MEMDKYAAIFSDEGLLGLHKAVYDAFKKDEATPKDEEKPYGVRIYADWRQWSDALECELTKRKIEFKSIPW